MTCWIIFQHPFELNSRRCTKCHGNKTTHCIVSKCVRENIHHATKSRHIEETCDLGHHVWVVLHLSFHYSAPLLVFWPRFGLKVNRKMKPVVILNLLTVGILSALDTNAAQGFFCCLENLTLRSPAEAWKPLHKIMAYDISEHLNRNIRLFLGYLGYMRWVQEHFSFHLFIVVIYYSMHTGIIFFTYCYNDIQRPYYIHLWFQIYVNKHFFEV